MPLTYNFGQQPGTQTNDNAAAGAVGEIISSSSLNETTTVTISNASPGVITWTAHGFNAGHMVNFTTTGGLPTGLSVGTNYYVCAGSTLLTNSFTVATSVANALAGTGVNTSSAGSGVHTGLHNGILANVTIADVCGISLTPGDWDVQFWAAYVPAASTSITQLINNISSSSASLTLVYPGGRNIDNMAAVVPGSTFFDLNTGTVRISLSSTTTIFGCVRANFTVSTMNVYGGIRARRVR